MIRYNFLLYHADVSEFMAQLRDLGVVDVTLSDWDAPAAQRSLMEKAEHFRKVHEQMASIAKEEEKEEKQGELLGVAPYATTDEAVAAFEEAYERRDNIQTLRLKATGELDTLAGWGDFDPGMIQRLRQEKGIVLRFFEVPTRRFDPEWESLYPIQVIGDREGGRTYFVLAQMADDGANWDLSLDSAVELKAPDMSYEQKEAQIEKYLRQEVEMEQAMRRAALSRDAIWTDYLDMKDRVNFEEAVHSGENFADGTIKIVEGFSVEEDRERVERFANEKGVIFTSEAATVEQNPPIKLKNTFFSRLFEPIGKLYMSPRYNELDMTPFFAPFFMLFFGLCLGDAGYGILIILAVLLLWKKIPAEFKGIAWLAIFLNIATVFVGIVTGNVFGIQLAEIPALVRFKQYFLNSDNMFNIALALGAVQILFGQIVRIFNRTKRTGSFLYGLSTVGWVILMVTGILAFLVGLPPVALYSLLGVAAVLILFFNSPGKNPFVNFGNGLYDTYNMATGVVGDLLSYIRLFAVGLSGGVIAQVFNELAVGLSPDIPVVGFIVMVIILLIGHGLNIFICLLGAIVHPLRLTFVEFYKNADFEGGGREFQPFRKMKRQKSIN